MGEDQAQQQNRGMVLKQINSSNKSTLCYRNEHSREDKITERKQKELSGIRKNIIYLHLTSRKPHSHVY